MTEHEDHSTDEDIAPAGPERQPGRELASARERAGISFETMAEGLRLPKRQLEALEADDYASLPPPAYVRGYLRAYAREVGLDGDEIVALFDAGSGDLHDPDLHPAVSSGSATAGAGGLLIGLGVIALVVIVGIGGWWWQGRPPADGGEPGDATAAAEDAGRAGADAREGRAAAGDDVAAGAGEATGDDAGPQAEATDAAPGDEASQDERVAEAPDEVGATSSPTPPGSGSAGTESPELAAAPDDDMAAAVAGDEGSDGTSGDAAADTEAERLATAGAEGAVQEAGTGEAAGAEQEAGTGEAAGAEQEAAAGAAVEAEEQEAAGTEVAEGTAQEDSGTEAAAGEDREAAGTEADAGEAPEGADTEEAAGAQDSPAATASAEEAATRAAAVGPDTLVLHFDDRSWVEVYDGGERELVYTLYLGSDPVRLRGWAPFDVFLGNSPAVTVTFNGQDVTKSAFTRSDNTARFLVDEDGARRR